MSTSLRVLLLEDNPLDAELVLKELRRAGFEPDWQRVETEVDFLDRLQPELDIILSDYDMPEFSGPRALELLKHSGMDIPFIIISGTIGEEVAVDVMKLGATDYLIKDRLIRLGISVRQAIEQGRLRRERTKAKEELSWKTAFLEAQVNSTLDGLLVVDAQGRKILQNQRMADLFKMPQYIADSQDDKEQLEWVTGTLVDPQSFMERVLYLYAHPEEISRDEIELKNGTVLDRYSSPVIGNDGKYYGRIWTFRDITERKNAASALLESKRFLQSTLNALTSHIAILDEHGTIIEVNAAWDRFASDNDFRGSHRGVGDNYLRLCDSASGRFYEEAVLVAAGIREVMAGQKNEFHLEYPCHGPQEQRWFVVRVTRFGGGGPLRVVVAHENISERKQAEDALRDSEERFRQLAENIQEVFWISDATKRQVFYVSPAYETIWGRSCESLYASLQTWHEALHPEDRERVMKAALTKQIDGTYDEEYRILRPDGSLRWVRDRAFPVKDTSGETYRIVGVARDISERKHAEDRLREQASLLDKARDAILVRDLEHGITYWNKSAEELYGWTAEEALGHKASELLYCDLSAYDKAVESVISQGEWHGEIQQVTRTGVAILIEARWTLVRDDDGRPKSILAINTDITEKKRLEQQFLRAQRMESIGTLAGGIAHDLNNVLAPIMMSIELLRLTSRDERAQSMLSTIETSARRGADMVQQILSFARGVEGQRVMINPQLIVEEIQHLVQDTFPKNILFQADLPGGPPAFLGDHTQVHQILLNLCVNARDAMPGGGTLTVSARSITLDENYAAMHASAKPGDYVMFKVTDTGCGIPPQVLEKIFDPFFTTKELGKGTGLGLSTVLAIVKSHDGFLNVYSEQNNGTTFTVFFPASVSASDVSGQIEEMHPRGRGELILVVDDEAAVRTITQQTLEAFGYRALVAADGAEALTLYSQHQAEVAAVLTDMMMPVMDGPATIQVLKHMNPAIKIIAASGLVNEEGATRAAGMGVKHFLPKPYTAQTVLTTLRQALDADAG